MRAIILSTTTKFFLAAAITHFQSAGNHNTNKKSVAAFVQSFHFVLPAYITGYHHHRHHSHHHHHHHHHHHYRHRHRRPSRSVNEGKERRQSSLIQSYNRCYSSSNNNDRSLELVTQQTTSDVTSTSKCHIKTKTNDSNSNNNNNNNWLVVGDGDLSYSSSIASDLANKNYTLFATVLEEEIDHNRIYKRSQKNTADIRSYYENNIYDDNMNLNNKSMMVPSQSFPSSFCLQHQVVFGIDATRLEDYDFSSFTGSSSTSSASTTASSEITTKFHKIEFNFPHWRGKTNNKWNRKLIHEFLRSACNVLQENDNDDDDDDDVSEIIISLCEGQGGLGPASNIQKWKQSWLVPAYAAEHGLLLQKLEQPFLPSYTQTSHRGKDRPWIKDGTAQRYHFRFPSSSYNWKKKKYILCPIPKSLQISCRHELRVVLPRESDLNNNNNVVEQQDSNNHNDYYNISTTRRDESNEPKPCRNDIIDGDAVYNLVNEFVPDGIRMDVVTREFVSPYNYTTTISTKVNGTVATSTSTSSLTTSCTKTITRTGILAVFLINYSGESLPLTRNLADSIRSQVERSVQERWQLDIRKGGLPVSKPFPTQLLSTLIKDFK